MTMEFFSADLQITRATSNNGDPKVDEFKNIVFVKEECFRVVGQNSVLLRAGAEILEVVVTPAHHVRVA